MTLPSRRPFRFRADIDLCYVKPDKASAILNDPNDWSYDPRYIVGIVKRNALVAGARERARAQPLSVGGPGCSTEARRGLHQVQTGVEGVVDLGSGNRGDEVHPGKFAHHLRGEEPADVRVGVGQFDAPPAVVQGADGAARAAGAVRLGTVQELEIVRSKAASRAVKPVISLVLSGTRCWASSAASSPIAASTITAGT
jgi:hypothetical protein